MTKRNILFFIILTLVIAVGAYTAFMRGDKGVLSGVRCQMSDVSCSWYAVHLSNGQVYFGHVSQISPDTITISDTHYLEVYQEGDNTISQSKNFAVQQAPKQIYSLIRRGDEKSLATDHTLYVNRSSVLFWEKLSNDSDIVASINATTGQKVKGGE